MKQDQYLIGKVSKLQTGKRLDKALAEIFPEYSRSKIKSWILNKQVRVNGLIIAAPKKKCLAVKMLI